MLRFVNGPNGSSLLQLGNQEKVTARLNRKRDLEMKKKEKKRERE